MNPEFSAVLTFCCIECGTERDARVHVRLVEGGVRIGCETCDRPTVHGCVTIPRSTRHYHPSLWYPAT